MTIHRYLIKYVVLTICMQYYNLTYVDTRVYPIDGHDYEDKADYYPNTHKNDFISSIDYQSMINRYLLMWVLGGTLFLPTAIKAVLNLDSIRPIITDLTSLLTTYYNSLNDTSPNITLSTLHLLLDRGIAYKGQTRISAAIKTKITIFIFKNYLYISKIFKEIIKVTCSELLK